MADTSDDKKGEAQRALEAMAQLADDFGLPLGTTIEQVATHARYLQQERARLTVMQSAVARTCPQRNSCEPLLMGGTACEDCPGPAKHNGPQISVYERAYKYLQHRLESIGYHGWAHDMDGEIERAPQSAIGLSTEQEPKYTVRKGRIVNRASGETIPDDEPVFIFRARDKQAAAVLRFYMTRVAGNAEHWGAVEQRLKDFQSFAEEHPDRMKEPDTMNATR